MAGYWASSICFCVFMDRDGVEVHKFAKKKSTRPMSCHLDRKSQVNKGFIIWLLGKFFSRATAGNPEWARQLYLARLGRQIQRAIWFILPAYGAIISRVLEDKTKLKWNPNLCIEMLNKQFNYLLFHVKSKFHIQQLNFMYNSFITTLTYAVLVSIDSVSAQH